MGKIIDPDGIDVGVELTLDTAASTFTLNVAGTLVAKDGVTIQALYSKFVDLWTTSTYNKFEFPMYTIDAKSGQYQFGTDGSTFSGWKPANDATRQMLRDGGWSEYSSAGVLNRQYVGIVSLGDVNTGAQLYYQKELGGTASNFTFTDECNEGIQVYGDASNGNFDNRTYFKGYVREYGKKYDDSVLADTGQSATGAYTVTGVYIDNYDANDVNRLVFTDQSGVQRTEPFTATGNLNFNAALTSGGTGYYRMYFTDLAGAADYGLTGAITVQNASAADIQGTISGSSIAFTFAYDSNVQGGRTAGTDAMVTVVAGNAGSAKPVVTNYTITRATGQNITLTAEQDRAYLI